MATSSSNKPIEITSHIRRMVLATTDSRHLVHLILMASLQVGDHERQNCLVRCPHIFVTERSIRDGLEDLRAKSISHQLISGNHWSRFMYADCCPLGFPAISPFESPASSVRHHDWSRIRAHGRDRWLSVCLRATRRKLPRVEDRRAWTPHMARKDNEEKRWMLLRIFRGEMSSEDVLGPKPISLIWLRAC